MTVDDITFFATIILSLFGLGILLFFCGIAVAKEQLRHRKTIIGKHGTYIFTPRENTK